MKFRGHETFYIRKGWLNKGLHTVSENPIVFVNKDENPMDILGVGSNMVKSIRYWLQATGLTREGVRGVRGQVLTPLGQLVFENDPYIEELGTLCLLHYNLVKGKDLSTTWYYFFNRFNMTEFEKEDFTSSLKNWAALNGIDIPLRSLDDDFNCLINTYLPRYKTSPEKVDPESNMECPISELGLLDLRRAKGRVYAKTAPVSMAIDPMIAIAIILDNSNGKKEVLLSELLNGDNNIGRVFNLDVISLMGILDSAEQTGLVRVVRTAGLDILKISTDMSFAECVKQFYDNLF